MKIRAFEPFSCSNFFNGFNYIITSDNKYNFFYKLKKIYKNFYEYYTMFFSEFITVLFSIYNNYFLNFKTGAMYINQDTNTNALLNLRFNFLNLFKSSKFFIISFKKLINFFLFYFRFFSISRKKINGLRNNQYKKFNYFFKVFKISKFSLNEAATRFFFPSLFFISNKKLKYAIKNKL